MRKKLLALVMCATMVLGTAVTAVAAPLQADYDNAKKVFTNGSKVASEIKANGSYKTVPVTVNVDLEGGVKYGFVDNKAVRLDAEGKKALKYVGKVDIDNTKKTKTVVNASVVADTAVADAIVKYGADANIAGKKAAYVANISVATAPAEYKVAVVTFTAGATTAAPGTPSVAYYTMKNTDKVDAVNLVLKADANYVTKDYYSYDTTSDGLDKADLQTSSEVGSYVYTVTDTTEENIDDDMLRTVAEALAGDNATLTKDAIALTLGVKQIVKNTDSATKDQHPYVLESVIAPVANVTLTMENDWFSNTALKAKTIKTFRVSDTKSADGKYNLLSLVESGIDLSESYGKFDVTFSVINGKGYAIFDVDSAASKDNAGQADADKSTSSPKTGDVAPIAALAVVMMGAFGAMVVASKKRA